MSITDKPLSTQHPLTDEIVEFEAKLSDLDIACKRAYRNRIQMGSGGNASTIDRSSNRMLIKASGYSFMDNKNDVFTISDCEGNPLQDGKKPSSESVLHGFLYEKYNDIKSIIHVHGPYAIAYSSNYNHLPQVTKQAQLKIGYDIPVINIEPPNVGKMELKIIEDYLKPYNKIKVFILKDHGIVAMGNSAVEAENLAELVEETAMVALLKSTL